MHTFAKLPWKFTALIYLMKKLNNQERVRRIYEMLFEMAQGNLSHKITIAEYEDDLDRISIALNDISAQLSVVLEHLGTEVHKFIFKSILEPLIVVEDDSIIKSFRPHLPIQLGYDQKSFNHLNFLKIIAPESISLYNYVKENLSDDFSVIKKFKLVFVGKDNRELHFYCTMEKHSPGNNVIISSVSNLFELTNGLMLDKKEQDSTFSIHDVYDYIINNFDKPLPSTIELGGIFKMNEFKLKYEFRNTFQTSIYQLYTDIRLRFALSQIENTNISLTAISELSGYTTYLSFYRAFCKKYNQKPSEIVRNAQ